MVPLYYMVMKRKIFNYDGCRAFHSLSGGYTQVAIVCKRYYKAYLYINYYGCQHYLSTDCFGVILRFQFIL